MIEVKKKEELDKLLKEKKKVFIKFGQDGCGPCRLVETTLMKLEPEYPEITFIKVDCEECEDEVLDEFSIQSIPTLIFNGEKIGGLLSEEKLKSILDGHEEDK